jgi:hypothetical protein
MTARTLPLAVALAAIGSRRPAMSEAGRGLPVIPGGAMKLP